MDIIKIIKFFKEQWLGSLLIILWLISIVFYQNKRDQLITEAENLKTKIEKLEEKESAYKKEIVLLKKTDTIIVEKIKKIKEKEYVQIKIIDSFTVSELQQFFTDRYSKER